MLEIDNISPNTGIYMSIYICNTLLKGTHLTRKKTLSLLTERNNGWHRSHRRVCVAFWTNLKVSTA